MTWNPMPLAHCLDSEWLAWTHAALCMGILAWYVLIATQWLRAARESSQEGRATWIWLTVIFVFCAMAGYAPIVLQLWWPKWGIALRLVALVVDNVACVLFWRSASSRSFTTMGRHEKIGSDFESEIRNADLSDLGELGRIARRVAELNLRGKS